MPMGNLGECAMHALVRSRACFSLAGISICTLLMGCGFLPGFAYLESPALYAIDVGAVANQVACELQEFAAKQYEDPEFNSKRWVLSRDDIGVQLTLQTDEGGYVNFTGVNAGALGFQALASLVALQSKVPTLGAKISAKTTKSAEIDFSVSAIAPKSSRTHQNDKGVPNTVTVNCAKELRVHLPVSRLYLKEWLVNYFDTINYHYTGKYETTFGDDPINKALGEARNIFRPDEVPDQLKITAVKLTSTILVAADVSAGATPNLLGNGSVFILPINGLTLDYNPDYSHKILISMNICHNSNGSCKPPKDDTVPWSPQLAAQCAAYATLKSLITGLNTPKNIQDGSHTTDSNGLTHANQWHCADSGKYAGLFVDDKNNLYSVPPTGPFQNRLLATQPPVTMPPAPKTPSAPKPQPG